MNDYPNIVHMRLVLLLALIAAGSSSTLPPCKTLQAGITVNGTEAIQFGVVRNNIFSLQGALLSSTSLCLIWHGSFYFEILLAYSRTWFFLATLSCRFALV